MSENFGSTLRELRLKANYGLRRFAKLIGELPSNLSAVETGARPPWRTMEKLRKVANALAIEEGTPEWDRFFIAARKPGTLPEDVERLISREMNLVVLRTIDEMQLTDDQLIELVKHMRGINDDSKRSSRRTRGVHKKRTRKQS